MILHYFQVCNIVIQHSYVPNKVITTINLITIYNHTKLLQYYWVYSSCHAAYYIPTTDLFYNWKFIPHSFLPPLPPPLVSRIYPSVSNVIVLKKCRALSEYNLWPEVTNFSRSFSSMKEWYPWEWLPSSFPCSDIGTQYKVMLQIIMSLPHGLSPLTSSW